MEIANTFILICTVITSATAVIAIIVNLVNKAKNPNLLQNKRLDLLEEEIAKINRILSTDQKRIDLLEEGNKITQQALLALMSHAINGNDIEKLSEAKNRLEQYLIDK